MIKKNILLWIIYLFRYSLPRLLYGIYYIGLLAIADHTLRKNKFLPPRGSFTYLKKTEINPGIKKNNPEIPGLKNKPGIDNPNHIVQS